MISILKGLLLQGGDLAVSEREATKQIQVQAVAWSIPRMVFWWLHSAGR